MSSAPTSDNITRRSEFSLPGANHRTVVIGANGTGKTVLGAWVLGKQRFKERPWVCLDFKNEELWDLVGDPPMRDLRLGDMPGKKGLYRMAVFPGEEKKLAEWLWAVWRKENIGLFVDEVTLIDKEASTPFKAILRQGRSKRIPVIACTQRPVDVDREVFTEANFVSVFRVDDMRDHKVIKMFTRDAPMEKPLPPFWSYWYDKGKNSLTILKPVPEPAMVAKSLREVAPYSFWLGL